MTKAILNSVDRDQRLSQVLDAYLAAVQTGTAPAQDDLLAQHPDLAEELRECLASLAFLRQAATPAKGGSAGADAEAAPRELGDFRLLREVGRGGMGVVYEAEQLSLGRRVALKVLPFAGVLDSRQLLRFQNEAKAAAGLHHTNIVPVFYVGSERGVHFFAMQFIEGQTLAELIRQLRQLDAAKEADQPAVEGTTAYQPGPGEAASPTEPVAAQATLSTRGPGRDRDYFRKVAVWGEQAAEALDYAHQAGIVHRDIKPANLMLDDHGTLWVTDFGLAQIQHGEANLTMTGDLIGTLRYMSPEQALAKRVVIDHRTDVYSLGVTLYELLTLQPAIKGKDRQELLRQVAFDEPTPPRKLSRAIPHELETVVLKAMEKNPQDRYATAAELAEDLHRWRAELPIRAKRPGVGQRLLKWARRNRRMVTAAGIGLVLVVAALAASTIYAAAAYRAERTERQKAQKAERLEADQRQTAERERDLAEQRLYLSDMQRAEKAWNTGDMGRLQQVLEKHRPGQGQRDRRGWEWYYLQAMCHKALLSVTRHRGDVWGGTQVAWSPDNRRLAIMGCFDCSIHIRDAVTGKIERTLLRETGKNEPRAIAWHPDGNRLASFSKGDPVKIWNLTTGLVESTVQTPTIDNLMNIAWDPAGRRLAVGGQTLYVCDVAAGKEVFRLSPGADRGAYTVAWSPKGDRLAVGNAIFTDNSYAVEILDTTRWQEVTNIRRTATAGQWVEALAWSPDGRQLVIGTAGGQRERQSEVADVTTGKEVFQLPGTFAPVAWSPDGRRLAGGSTLPFIGITIWDATTGKVLSKLRGHTEASPQVAWSPDGRRLASSTASGEIKVWDVTREQEYQVLRGHKGSVFSVAWSADGTRLASGSEDRTIKIWDMTTGNPHLTLGGSDKVTSLSWSPDGRQLASAMNVEQPPPAEKFRVWDAATGNEVRTLVNTRPPRGSAFSASGVAWSPDGRRLVTRFRDATLKVWEVATWQDVQTLDTPLQIGPGPPVWSPDGKWLAVDGLGGLIHIWDTATWQETLPSSTRGYGIWVLAWSPDSKRLAFPSGDNTIKLWDLGTREVISSLQGHTADAPAVAWSPDGQRLASAGRDGTIKIWDVAMGEELLSLPEQALALSWSPDGRRLASGSPDGTIKLWDASPGYNVPRPPPSRNEIHFHRVEIASALKELGRALEKLPRPQEAEAAYRKSLAILEGLTAEFPDVIWYRWRLIDTSMELAGFLEHSGQFAAAEQAYRTALDHHDSSESPAYKAHVDYRTLKAVVHYHLARLLMKMGHIPRAAEHYFELAQLVADPAVTSYRRTSKAMYFNSIAWFLATCSDPKYRDAKRAVELAGRAVESSNDPECWNTLGVAQYQANEWKDAVETLAKSTHLRKGGDSFDFFFLAMAHWQLGDKDKARQWYTQAVQWMDKNQPQDEELRRFRAQATTLLELKEAPPRQPDAPATKK